MAAQLVASRVVLSSTELVSWFNFRITGMTLALDNKVIF
jgi:hypothetical protein